MLLVQVVGRSLVLAELFDSVSEVVVGVDYVCVQHFYVFSEEFCCCCRFSKTCWPLSKASKMAGMVGSVGSGVFLFGRAVVFPTRPFDSFEEEAGAVGLSMIACLRRFLCPKELYCYGGSIMWRPYLSCVIERYEENNRWFDQRKGRQLL